MFSLPSLSPRSLSLAGRVQDVGQSVARGVRQRIAFQPESNSSKIAMTPLVATAAVLLYNQGAQESADKHGGHGESDAWKRVLEEALLGRFLANTIDGAYPLVGILMGAFRAGKEDTLSGKLHALVNTATTLCLGWLGVNLFAGIAMAAREFDDQTILKGLNHDKLAVWLNGPLRASHPEVAEAFDALRVSLTEKATHKTPDRDRIAQVQDHKSEVMKRLSEVEKPIIPPAGGHGGAEWHALTHWIDFSDSWLIRFQRYANPVCGYVLMGLLLGAPLARWLNDKVDALLEHRAPGLKTRHISQGVFPKNNAIIQASFLPDFYSSSGHHEE